MHSGPFFSEIVLIWQKISWKIIWSVLKCTYLNSSYTIHSINTLEFLPEIREFKVLCDINFTTFFIGSSPVCICRIFFLNLLSAFEVKSTPKKQLECQRACCFVCGPQSKISKKIRTVWYLIFHLSRNNFLQNYSSEEIKKIMEVDVKIWSSYL